MPYSNSQEQTIYRSLAGQIQLGFYDDGERFPSAMEVARRYGVSYCPAQRALKLLEDNHLITLCRGKETLVVAKPFENYLESITFRERANTLLDLTKSLELISPAITLYGMKQMDKNAVLSLLNRRKTFSSGKLIYRFFNETLMALGSRTVLSLYYDIGAMVESAYLDIISSRCGKEGAESFFQNIVSTLLQCLNECMDDSVLEANTHLYSLGQDFFIKVREYLEEESLISNPNPAESFIWEPHKGRIRYCDDIAIDMVCKINQGVYPVGTLLPTNDILANIYHVSSITIRRTVGLLNKLGVVRTFNGVGTRVVSPGNSDIPLKLKELMLDNNLTTFLEALQLLLITCEPVLLYTYSYFTPEHLDMIVNAASITDQKKSMVTVLSSVMQAIIQCCPIVSLKEIYSKITLLLLKGGILRLNETGKEPVSEWESITESITKSCQANDSVAFAQAFHKIIQDAFTATKEILLEIGVSDIEKIK